MENQNIKLWNSVCITNPAAVKSVNQGGRRFDTVDAYYLIKLATKKFGPMGRWGLKNMTHHSMNIGDTILLTLDAVFFYPDEVTGQEVGFEISNTLKLAYKTNPKSGDGYIKIDEDAHKKLHTNTISKALSYIGFSSDIYENKFADQEYLAEAFGTHELCTPEQKQELRKALGYYKADLSRILAHFAIPVLTDLPAKNYGEAIALIQNIGEK